ncbi:diacylglycerol kinase family lipid kinase [Pedobacter changchengzhani]|uniref:Diacylglycerol kinase family lipid kinase n=1 Tax=Pedobacter changchengzhani TaxID=2529274 RepID=A0A4R5MNU5_9SPHI|nr:diacylglycerol kinase family protein [Pedobacter changchengzhani]TDG37266.1 diacylglycerol kinase family lipid kinase [Pedobacter changchengzhani]
MQNKINILFIINPISGGKQKGQVPTIIDRYLDKERFSPNFLFSEHVGHAKEMAEEAVNKNFDVIVAAGGDGTINEVASVLARHNKILGILPLGSGNGLASHLKISKNIKDAIEIINKFKIVQIDSATLNGKFFFNLAGMGFDAHLSALFSNSKKRGFNGYFQIGIKQVFTYKPQLYELIIDGVKYTRKAFAISIANSSQYGNNVFISPLASVTDGLLDVCIIKPFPLLKLPVLSYVMLRAKAEESSMIEIIKGKSIIIKRESEGPVHIDGEPLLLGDTIEVNINPLSLKIILP